MLAWTAKKESLWGRLYYFYNEGYAPNICIYLRSSIDTIIFYSLVLIGIVFGLILPISSLVYYIVSWVAFSALSINFTGPALYSALKDVQWFGMNANPFFDPSYHVGSPLDIYWILVARIGNIHCSFGDCLEI